MLLQLFLFLMVTISTAVQCTQFCVICCLWRQRPTKLPLEIEAVAHDNNTILALKNIKNKLGYNRFITLLSVKLLSSPWLKQNLYLHASLSNYQPSFILHALWQFSLRKLLLSIMLMSLIDTIVLSSTFLSTWLQIIQELNKLLVFYEQTS